MERHNVGILIFDNVEVLLAVLWTHAFSNSVSRGVGKCA